MTTQTIGEGTPWYQHFWPWFIVILMTVSVIGSLVTVAIAYRHRDIDVRTMAPRALPQALPEAGSSSGGSPVPGG